MENDENQEVQADQILLTRRSGTRRALKKKGRSTDEGSLIVSTPRNTDILMQQKRKYSHSHENLSNTHLIRFRKEPQSQKISMVSSAELSPAITRLLEDQIREFARLCENKLHPLKEENQKLQLALTHMLKENGMLLEEIRNLREDVGQILSGNGNTE